MADTPTRPVEQHAPQRDVGASAKPAWVTDPTLIDQALAEGARFSEAMDRAMRGMRAISASDMKVRIR